MKVNNNRKDSNLAFGGQKSAKRSAPQQFTKNEKTALEFKELSEFGVYKVMGVSSSVRGPTGFSGSKKFGVKMEFSQKDIVRSTVHESEDERFSKTAQASDQCTGKNRENCLSLGIAKVRIDKEIDEESGNQLPSETLVSNIADRNISEIG